MEARTLVKTICPSKFTQSINLGFMALHHPILHPYRNTCGTGSRIASEGWQFS